MDIIIPIMVILLGAFILAIAFFDKLKNWRYFKPLIIVLFIIYASVAIWEFFIKKSEVDKTSKTITTTIDSTGKSVRLKMDTSTHSITHNTDSNTDIILKSIPKPIKTYYKIFTATAGQRVFVVPFKSSDHSRYRVLVNGTEFDDYIVKKGEITVGMNDLDKGTKIKVYWTK